jgi:amidophosphoribosyltransferase
VKEILLVGKNTGLSDRFELVLKRNFSVTNAYDALFDVTNSLEKKRKKNKIESFLLFKDIDFVVINSDILLSKNNNIERFVFSVIECCKKLNIKMFFCVQKNPLICHKEYFCFADDIDTKYLDRLSLLISTINFKTDLYVELDFAMGTAVDPYVNLLNYSNKEEKTIDFKIGIDRMISLDLADNIIESLVLNGKEYGEIALLKSMDITKKDFFKKAKIFFENFDDEVNVNKDSLKVNDDKITSFFRFVRSQQNCVFEVVYRMSPHDYIGFETVASFRRRLGSNIINEIPSNIKDEISCVVPIPETGKHYAQGLAESLKVPYVEAIFKNPKSGRGFDIQDSDKRRHFIYEKLSVIRDLVRDKNICLVDEAIFTGATLRVVSNILKGMGANKIFIALPTPQCRTQCHVNMQPPRSMLMEYQRTEDLSTYFDVDGVYFKGLNNFKTEICSNGQFCHTCFSK